MKTKIMIIDDSIVSANYIKQELVKIGYEIVISNDTDDHIELILKHDIDIILLDIIMPTKSGYDLLTVFRDSDISKDVPIIIISELESAKEVKKALDLGALDFIRKTAEAIEITARVSAAVKLKKKHDQLVRTSQIDQLTQLHNKGYFNSAIEQVFKEKEKYGEGVALVMVDCDHFKNINDSFGHLFGDLVLSSIANALQKSIKQMDIACRFGGEELCAILLNVTPLQALIIAERIRTNIGKITFNHNNQVISITVSCGISHTKPGDEKSGRQLIDEADKALYAAKIKGRNRSEIFSNIKND